MKPMTASISLVLLLAALAGGVGRAHAGFPPAELCCVCTGCEFSEQCFTGLTGRESTRCTDACNQVDCDAGDLREGACESFSPLCEVISPALLAAHAAPVFGPLALALAALAAGLAGGLRFLRGQR